MIYIVEDDDHIRQMEGYALRNSGFSVLECRDGPVFFAACKEALPELVILDIMLPGEDDGLQIVKKLKSDRRTSHIPVIMVTAKSTELDAVHGLEAGADDYIMKPFGIMEFIARVKAVLRRTEKPPEATVFRLEKLLLEDNSRQVTVAGVPCDLTYKEFELLKFLLANQGLVLSRDKIMDAVWGTAYEGESRTVDMHIKTLRQKLGECGQLIKTVRNVGYKIG